MVDRMQGCRGKIYKQEAKRRGDARLMGVQNNENFIHPKPEWMRRAIASSHYGNKNKKSLRYLSKNYRLIFFIFREMVPINLGWKTNWAFFTQSWTLSDRQVFLEVSVGEKYGKWIKLMQFLRLAHESKGIVHCGIVHQRVLFLHKTNFFKVNSM